MEDMSNRSRLDYGCCRIM